MNSKTIFLHLYIVSFILMLTLFSSCDDYIIQRAASDYFIYQSGNWWQLTSSEDTMLVEIEPVDTILQITCFPITFGGYVQYHAIRPEAIDQYIKIVYNFAGEDYTVIENFIRRIELPLVKGNTWQDSLIASIDVSGTLITGKYYLNGRVLGFEYSSEYEGDVYDIELKYVETIILPDSTLTDTYYVIESYGPGIGLVGFETEQNIYTLLDYEIQ